MRLIQREGISTWNRIGLIKRSVIPGMGVFVQCSNHDYWIHF